MATYYVWNGASGTASGADWTNAFTTFGAGISAATSSGDIIKVDKDHVEDLSVDTTYTLANNISVICVDKDSSDALAVMDGTSAYIGHSSQSRNIIFNGAYDLYVYGICFRTAGSSTRYLYIGSVGDGSSFVLESCKLWWLTNNAGSHIRLGTAGNNIQSSVRLLNCEFYFGGSNNFINIYSLAEIVGCSMHASSGIPSNLFQIVTNSDPGGTSLRCYGCDFGVFTGTVVGPSAMAAFTASFSQCRFGSGFSAFTASPVANNLSAGEVFMYDCSAGDQHYHLIYENALGKLSVDAGVYVTSDGAEYSAGSTTPVSWKIVTSSVASFFNPFITPWITRHNEVVSPTTISPYLEALSATSGLNESDVWSEWLYKGSSGYTNGTFDNSDRGAAYPASTTDQAAGTLAETDWTETGTNYTYKLGPVGSSGAITCQEIGDVCARVCVGKDSTTVYVDPQIRGLS